MKAKSELSFDGVNDDDYRNAFAHMKPDEQRRFFERALKQSMSGALLRSPQPHAGGHAGHVVGPPCHLEFSVAGMTAPARQSHSQPAVDWQGLGVVNFILNGAGLEKRKYPMQTFVACGLAETISLKLDPGFGQAVSLPSYPPIDDHASSYQRDTFPSHDGPWTAPPVDFEGGRVSARRSTPPSSRL